MLRHNLFSLMFKYFLRKPLEKPGFKISFLPTLVCFLHIESTSEISEYSSEDASKTSESSSQNTTSIKTNNIDKSTLAYNTTVTNKPETNHSASEIIYSKTTWKSYTRRHTSKTGMCTCI